MFLLIVFKCHHKPFQLLLILLCCHCIRHWIFNTSWHCIDFGIRCVLDRFLLLSQIPDYVQYLHSQCEDMHLLTKNSRNVEWDSVCTETEN